jgi:hypothetical protein
MPPEKSKPADDVDPKDEELEDEEELEEEDGDDFQPPKTKAELDALIKAASNTEAKKWRLRAMGRDPKWSGGKTDPPKNDPPKQKEDGDGTKTPEEIKAEVRAEVQAEFDKKANEQNLRASVATALLTAGLNLSEEEGKSPEKARKAVNRVVGMMDLGNMALEDDGSIAGLDDEINDLRKTYPGLFKSAGSGTGSRGRAGGDAGPKRGGAGGTKDPLEEMAEAFLKVQ